VLAVTLGPFVIMRWVVLAGGGGYEWAASQRTVIEFTRVFLQYLLDPIRVFGNWAGLLLVPILIGIVIRRPRWGGGMVVVWMGAFFGAHLGLNMLTARPILLLPWYLYLALPPICLALAMVLVPAATGLIRSSAQFWGWQGVALVPALIALVISSAWIVSSPLVQGFPLLEAGSKAHEAYLEKLDHAIRARAPEARSVRPGPFPHEVRSNVGGSATLIALTPRAIEAWMELVHPQILAVFVPDPRFRDSVPEAGDLIIDSGFELLVVQEGEIVFRGDFLEAYRMFWAKRGKEVATGSGSWSKPESWYQLGERYVRDGRLDKAEGAFREAILLRPDYWEAHYALARLYALRGDRAAAREELKEALRLNPDLELTGQGPLKEITREPADAGEPAD
jgi:hypothetical protein